MITPTSSWPIWATEGHAKNKSYTKSLDQSDGGKREITWKSKCL